MCPDLPLCPGNPCHDDWWKENEDSPFYFGCTDTDDSGTSWCPSPGGVDTDSIVVSGMVYTCTADEFKRAGPTVVRTSNTENQCPDEALQDCQGTVPDEDMEYCEAIKNIYPGTNKKNTETNSPRNEDIGFVKMLIYFVGWSPLDKGEKNYQSPFVKYKFYQDVLNQLDKIAESCTSSNEDIANGKLSISLNEQCPMEIDCSKISAGSSGFTTKANTAVTSLSELSVELDELTKEYAKKKIATAAVSTAAGAVGIGAAIVGIFFGKSKLLMQ